MRIVSNTTITAAIVLKVVIREASFAAAAFPSPPAFSTRRSGAPIIPDIAPRMMNNTITTIIHAVDTFASAIKYPPVRNCIMSSHCPTRFMLYMPRANPTCASGFNPASLDATKGKSK